MTTTLLTHDLQTDDITVMSNLTSITVVGSKISSLDDPQVSSRDSSSTVHLDFDVKEPTPSSGVLDSTETLGMIFKQGDAINLGLWLIAMGMEHKTSDDVDAIVSRLTQLLKTVP